MLLQKDWFIFTFPVVRILHSLIVLSMNRTLLFLIPLACLLVLLVAAATQKKEKTDFDAAAELIVMRKIGHRILQYTGDSTSRVMPVTQPSATEFLIPFETSFSFQPDSLVRIIDDIIKAHSLLPDYIVNVTECSNGTITFGYAMLGSQQTEIVSCGGRKQPVLNYCINIKFREKKKNTLLPYLAGGISLLLLCGFLWMAWFTKKKKGLVPLETVNENTSTPAVNIGSYLFYPEQLLLVYNQEKTVLTNKESKLLSIFAEHSNQIVDRSKLQKEVWEDEGVIVGRSLDVFISRLRKKLEKDADVQLVTIHGKGYKLEIKEKDA
jgi:DNA-binding winged helix-turn-helix (wHTH) protein